MTILDALQCFQKQLLFADHLNPIYNEQPFIIKLEAIGQRYVILIEKNEVKVISDDEGDNVNLIIQGTEKAIINLVDGKERLQRLQKKGAITVQGNFSDVLKGETVFYLGKIANSSKYNKKLIGINKLTALLYRDNI